MTYVFLGPSLPLAEARRHLNGKYFPPVKPGDIRNLLQTHVDAIVIIDGTTRGPEVQNIQNEIANAVSNGVIVVGGASMGAALAASTTHLGMVGLGYAFSHLNNCNSNALDEVAVAHGSRRVNYLRISESLCDIRSSVNRAIERGVLTQSIADAIICEAKRAHYLDRHYDRIIDLLPNNIAETELLAFKLFLASIPRASELDSVATLKYASTLVANGMTERDGLDGGCSEDHGLTCTYRESPNHSKVAADLRAREKCGESDAVVRKKTLLRLLARKEAARSDLRPTSTEVQAMSEKFRNSFSIHDGAAMEKWLNSKQLSVASYVEAMHDFILVDSLEAAFSEEIDILALEHVAVSSARGWRS